MAMVESPSSRAEVIVPSSSGRHSTTSRLIFVQSRTNPKRTSLHSILGAGTSLTALSIHALFPFGFHLQVRKCFIHLCSSEAGLFQQGKRMHIGANHLMWLYQKLHTQLLFLLIFCNTTLFSDFIRTDIGNSRWFSRIFSRTSSIITNDIMAYYHRYLQGFLLSCKEAFHREWLHLVGG